MSELNPARYNDGSNASERSPSEQQRLIEIYDAQRYEALQDSMRGDYEAAMEARKRERKNRHPETEEHINASDRPLSEQQRLIEIYDAQRYEALQDSMRGDYEAAMEARKRERENRRPETEEHILSQPGTRSMYAMAQEIATLRHANTDPADVASKTRISDLEDELQELLLEYSDMVETSHDKAVLAAKLNRSTPKGDRIKQAELEKTNAEVRAGRDDIELILETAAGEHYVEDADDDESDDGTEKKGTEPTDDSAEGGASSADEQGADSGDAATGESGDKGKDEDEDKGDAPSGDETSTDSDKPAGTDSEERPEGFEEETTLLDRARKRVGKAVTRLVGLSVAAYSARRSRKTEDTPDSQRAANESGDTTADETQQREASEANSTPVDSPDDAGLDQKLFEMGKPVEPLRRKATKWTGEPFAVRPKGPVRGEKADATKEKTGWLRSERGRKAAAALAIVASAGLSFFASQHSNNEAPAQKPAAVETTVDDAAQGSSSPTTEAPLAVDGGGVAATDTEIAPSDAGSEQVTLAPDGADGEYGPVIDSLSDEVRVIERGEGGFQTLAELGVPAQDRERVWEQVGTYLASAGRGDLVYRMDDGKWGWSNSGTLTDETLALILQGMNSTSSTGASELPETN